MSEGTKGKTSIVGTKEDLDEMMKNLPPTTNAAEIAKAGLATKEPTITTVQIDKKKED